MLSEIENVCDEAEPVQDVTERLAHQVSRSCLGSSTLFHPLAREVTWFRSLLEVTKSSVEELDPNYQHSSGIETVVIGISDSLTEIQRSVSRFEDLPTRTQWTWERLDASTFEIRHLREMLDRNVVFLNALNSSLSSYSQKAIISKLEKFYRDVRSGSRQESRSSLDSLNVDETEGWRIVRKHLEDVGITPQLFDQHHALIKKSILEAMISGKLDEAAPKDQEEAVNNDNVPCGTGTDGIYFPHHNSAGFGSTANFSPDGFNLDEEGTPQWYVHRVMDNTITAKQLQSLSETIKAQPITWVKTFVECQGLVALRNVLSNINYGHDQRTEPEYDPERAKDLDREYRIVKCLKASVNNKFGANGHLADQQVMVALATLLTSVRLSTRKVVSEILTFLCRWNDGCGHPVVMQALDYVKNQHGEKGRFDAWMRNLETTVDGRGKIGSFVAASDELRMSGIGISNLFMEYVLGTMFLINMIVDVPEEDLQLRVHIRAQLISGGLKRILTKMEKIEYDVIDRQIQRFLYHEGLDYED